MPDPRDPDTVPVRHGPPARIGHYTITGTLGRGGMGVVYAARDERLGRAVAIKTMTSVAADETSRKRFWREARAAASVNHPNVCQLYEIGEDQGELYIAMEMLEGESLATRLQRGPVSVVDALPVVLGILAALAALHVRGIIHRDLKPSNVFLTPHGVKLLDFGLARPIEAGVAPSLDTASDLTGAGILIGTPRYMAPEQVTGEALDARTDLFATGAILFEMLAGRPAFDGRNVVEILHAVLHDHPPALTGSPAVTAVDRVIRRALARRPADRPASADAMAAELRAVPGESGDQSPALARAMTRLVVLPFRILRADPETDFLAFSLPDAIATTLSGFGSLVVRSSATAARFGGDAPDLKAIATEADVDRVVMGTLMRSGDRLRATAQLVEAPAGTLLTSHTIESSLGDLFGMQDDITRRLVEALSLPLTAGGAVPTGDVPRDARAYALYLRANELAREYPRLPQARELYQQCVDLDPGFAPAWARLARCHWVIGKYLENSPGYVERAEAALRRALELNPRESMAHKLYAGLEADAGESRRAMVRLLAEANRHGNDPELFAGLVRACRYCGLYEQSIAAHFEARRLDPNIVTGFEQTIVRMGDYDRLFATLRRRTGDDEVLRIVGLGLTGRRDEALEALQRLPDDSGIAAIRPWMNLLKGWLERSPADMLAARSELAGFKFMDDPEAMFQEGWMFCDVGGHERGLELVRRAVAQGYTVASTLARAPQFDALRGTPSFEQVLADATAGRERALEAFRDGGGETLLGR